MVDAAPEEVQGGGPHRLVAAAERKEASGRRADMIIRPAA
jgi:hypothetical protein